MAPCTSRPYVLSRAQPRRCGCGKVAGDTAGVGYIFNLVVVFELRLGHLSELRHLCNARLRIRCKHKRDGKQGRSSAGEWCGKLGIKMRVLKALG